jgi:two-component system nitrate/nitrite response regulator NarL
MAVEATRARPARGAPGRRAPASLTDRQAEVLRHLTRGRSNKQIANRLGISEATVKVHVSAILRALGLHTRVEAALLAQKDYPSA